MDVPGPQGIVVWVTARPPKPFNRPKAMDICKVAQRILDETGHVYVTDVYNRCRARIPGAFKRYAATMAWLAEADLLKPHRKNQ
jgi:hypothetical protein